MEENSRLELIFKEAYHFLERKVEKNILEKHLEYYHTYRPESISEIFRKMVGTLTNRQGYVNYIASPEELKDILFDFNPKKILEEVTNWEQLFDTFKKKFRNKYKMDINNKKNAWVIYSQGVISCAKFISNFKDHNEFDKFIKI